MNQFKDLFLLFATAPSNRLDASQSIKFKEFAQRDTDPAASELREILDICANSSLASDFTMEAIHLMWQKLLITESELGANQSVPGSYFDLGQIAHESCIKPEHEKCQ